MATALGFETDEEREARLKGQQASTAPLVAPAPLAGPNQSQAPATQQKQPGVFDTLLQGKGMSTASDLLFDSKKAAAMTGPLDALSGLGSAATATLSGTAATGALSTAMSAAAPWLALGYMGGKKLKLFNEGTDNVQGDNMQRFNPANPYGYASGGMVRGPLGYAYGTETVYESVWDSSAGEAGMYVTVPVEKQVWIPDAGATIATYHDGTKYDANQIKSLASELGLNTLSMSGGALNTNKESIGFNYDQAQKILGKDNVTTQEQILLDAAAGLASQGITSLKDIEVTKVPVLTETESGSVDTGQTRDVYINKNTGQEVSQALGATYTGKGGTVYGLVNTANGLKLNTTGESSRDGIVDLAITAASIYGAATLPTVFASLGTVGSAAATGATIGAGRAAATGENIAKGAITGGVLGGLTAYGSNLLNGGANFDTTGLDAGEQAFKLDNVDAEYLQNLTHSQNAVNAHNAQQATAQDYNLNLNRQATANIGNPNAFNTGAVGGDPWTGSGTQFDLVNADVHTDATGRVRSDTIQDMLNRGYDIKDAVEIANSQMYGNDITTNLEASANAVANHNALQATAQDYNWKLNLDAMGINTAAEKGTFEKMVDGAKAVGKTVTDFVGGLSATQLLTLGAGATLVASKVLGNKEAANTYKDTSSAWLPNRNNLTQVNGQWVPTGTGPIGRTPINAQLGDSLGLRNGPGYNPLGLNPLGYGRVGISTQGNSDIGLTDEQLYQKYGSWDKAAQARDVRNATVANTANTGRVTTTGNTTTGNTTAVTNTAAPLSAAVQWAKANGTIGSLDKNIKDWFLANPKATDKQIRLMMDQWGVSPTDVSRATGSKEADVTARYLATFPAGTTQAQREAIAKATAADRVAQQQAHAGESAAVKWAKANGQTVAQLDSQIKDWFAKNPKATDAQTRVAMDQWGVNSGDVARALGGNVTDYTNRYLATGPLGGTQAENAAIAAKAAADRVAAQTKAAADAQAAQAKAAADAQAAQQAAAQQAAANARAAETANWFTQNQGATDNQIYNAAVAHGRTAQEIATATGGALTDVQARWDAQAARAAETSNWFTQNPNATHEQIYQTAVASGRTPAEIAVAMNLPVETVQTAWNTQAAAAAPTNAAGTVTANVGGYISGPLGLARGGFINPSARNPKQFPLMPNNPAYVNGPTGSQQNRQGGNPRYQKQGFAAGTTGTWFGPQQTQPQQKGGVGSRGGLPFALGIPNPTTRAKKRGGE